MQRIRIPVLCALVAIAASQMRAQDASANGNAELRLQIAADKQQRAFTAVAWAEPAAGTDAPAFVPAHHYTLLQKNRMFTPHLLVIPVGSVVDFPNADPFYHNVFSLFDGKRFDLGLYEAGSSKAVTFSREGVSYIFCNIHPEMSAVVLALSTPYYAVADAHSTFTLHNLPPGDYRLHLWIEGLPQADLDRLTRRVHLAHSLDLGLVSVPQAAQPPGHANKFGKPYSQDPRAQY